MVDSEIYSHDLPRRFLKLIFIEVLVGDLYEAKAIPRESQLQILVLKGSLRLHEVNVGLEPPQRVDIYEEPVINELPDDARFALVLLLTQVFHQVVIVVKIRIHQRYLESLRSEKFVNISFRLAHSG